MIVGDSLSLFWWQWHFHCYNLAIQYQVNRGLIKHFQEGFLLKSSVSHGLVSLPETLLSCPAFSYSFLLSILGFQSHLRKNVMWGKDPNLVLTLFACFLPPWDLVFSVLRFLGLWYFQADVLYFCIFQFSPQNVWPEMSGLPSLEEGMFKSTVFEICFNLYILVNMQLTQSVC